MANEDRPGGTGDPLDETGIGRSIELRPCGHLGEALGEGQTEPPVDSDFPAFRRLVLFGVLGGLAPLLPGSIGEGAAVEAVCTRMVTELSQSRDLSLDPQEVRLLAAPEAAPPVPPALRPLVHLHRLLLRPFPGLAGRDGAHRSAEVFGRGYLLLHAAGLEMAELYPPDRTEARVRQVRAAIDQAMLAADRPLEEAIGPLLRSSSPLLRRAANLLADAVRRAPGGGALTSGSGVLTAANQILGGLVDRIAAALWDHGEALGALSRSFEIQLARERGLSLPSAGT
jgi:hypothetical protein